MTLDPYVSVFGLLVRTPPDPPEGPVLKEYTLDSFRVVEQAKTVTLHCKCGRSESLLLSLADVSRIHPVHGFYACPKCLYELQAAHTVAQKVSVWLRQNNSAITAREHLRLPNNLTRFMDPESRLATRPRRFIYSSYFDVDLSSKENIVSTCSDPHCVNPLHCQIASSPATKVTTQMIEDVAKWIQKGISNKTLQELIEIKYGISLSMRSINNIKRSALLLTATQNCYAC